MSQQCVFLEPQSETSGVMNSCEHKLKYFVAVNHC